MSEAPGGHASTTGDPHPRLVSHFNEDTAAGPARSDGPEAPLELRGAYGTDKVAIVEWASEPSAVLDRNGSTRFFKRHGAKHLGAPRRQIARNAARLHTTEQGIGRQLCRAVPRWKARFDRAGRSERQQVGRQAICEKATNALVTYRGTLLAEGSGIGAEWRPVRTNEI